MLMELHDENGEPVLDGLNPCSNGMLMERATLEYTARQMQS